MKFIEKYVINTPAIIILLILLIVVILWFPFLVWIYSAAMA